MPVDMSIVPHPHVHHAPSSGHHGHLPDFFKMDFQVTSNMNAGIVFQSNIDQYVNELHKYLKQILNEKQVSMVPRSPLV